MAGWVTVDTDDLDRVIRLAAIACTAGVTPENRTALLRLARQRDRYDTPTAPADDVGPCETWAREWLNDPRPETIL